MILYMRGGGGKNGWCTWKQLFRNYSHKLQDSIQILEGKIGLILGPVWMQLFDLAPYFKVTTFF